MKKQAIHSGLIFKIVTLFVTCFLMLFGFFVLLNTTKENKNINILHAATSHVLTIIIDENVTNGSVNGESLSFQTQIDEDDNIIKFATKNIVEDTEVSMLFGFDEEYVFDKYIAYSTGNKEVIFEGIVGNGFFMPHYDLTIFVKSKPKQFVITINKIMYISKTQTLEPITEQQRIDPEADFEYEIVVPANYHLYMLNENCFESDIDNLIINENILSATNILADGIINIYFERNYFLFNVFYGANDDINDKKGGSVTVNSDDYVFADGGLNYVYFNENIGLHIQVLSGYRLDSYVVLDSAMEQSGYTDFTELDESNNFTINQVYSIINVYVRFVKTFDIAVYLNKVAIGSEMLKIAKIAYEAGSFDDNDLFNTLDINSYVTYQTKINSIYSRKYEFKRWNITNRNGSEIDAETMELLNIQQTYNKQTDTYSLKINNLITDLRIQAIYGIKEFDFTIGWNTFNGSVVADVEGTDYVYKIEFGNEIIITLTPDDEMRFLKTCELLGRNEFVTENVFELLELDETDAENVKKVRISNITENLTLKIEFVVNTWWEHLLTDELIGKGTSAEPYLISNASDLALVGYLINNKKVEKDGCIYYAEAYYKLTNNIDCGHEFYFVPIGTLKSQFNGIFDYNYCRISNIWTEKEITNYKLEGLFDVIGGKAKIINKDRSYLEYILYVLATLAVFGLIVYFVLLAEKIRSKPKKVVYLDGQEEVVIENKDKLNDKPSGTKNKVLTKDEILKMARSKKENETKTNNNNNK